MTLHYILHKHIYVYLKISQIYMQILDTYSKENGWLAHLRIEELAGTNSHSSCPPPGGCSSQAVNRGDSCYMFALLPIHSFCDNELPVNQGTCIYCPRCGLSTFFEKLTQMLGIKCCFLEFPGIRHSKCHGS